MSYCRPAQCPDPNGCPPGVCPDLIIRRHDTRPAFEYDMGREDLTDVVVEASMWAKARLKAAVAADDTTFGLADGVGFYQAKVGDMVVMDSPRATEQMLVVGFDEDQMLLVVERGYNNTAPAAFKKGTGLKVFRVLNAVGATETTTDDVLQIDGTTDTGVVTASKILYEWDEADTALAGCFWLELKAIKMDPDTGLPVWVRRFPADAEAFLVKIIDSPTADEVVVVTGRHVYGSGGRAIRGAALASHA